MYEEYWRIRRPAFENDVDPSFYFAAPSHQGALLKLRYLIEHHKGVGLLVGANGLGKTYLMHVLERDLDPERFPLARLVFPQLSPHELLRYLAVRLGAATADRHPDGAGLDHVLCALEEHLARLTADGRRAVFIVDEAHLLEPQHLRTLQLLLNFREEPRIEFSLLLAGRPDLLPRVERLPELNDRVALRAALRPLSETDTFEYVRHRLKTAGRGDCPFTHETMRSFWELSHGVPRRINQLCDLALLVGFADELQALTPVEIEAAAEELACVSAD
jgi:general secretion pathway protein A